MAAEHVCNIYIVLLLPLILLLLYYYYYYYHYYLHGLTQKQFASCSTLGTTPFTSLLAVHSAR